MLSRFGNPKDERTTHERWCDKMVEKASRPRFYGGTLPQKKAPSGVIRNNYTSSELITLFGKMH